MTKKTQKNYDVSDACADLCCVGRMYVCNGGFDDISGKTCITLAAFQKKKNASELDFDADFAMTSLKELGFKDTLKDGSEIDGVMAMADIVVEYDINKKPYTITNANLQELKALKEVMDYSGAKVQITRNEPKFAKVRADKFKQAVANYIAQNQK